MAEFGANMSGTLVVDGNNLLSRAAFAASGKRAEMSVDGVNTSALFIFINMLSRYVRIVEPSHMCVCWDRGHRYRDAISSDYKANRKKRTSDDHGDSEDGEDEGYPETPWDQAHEFLLWANIGSLEMDGHEADDLIALVAQNPRVPKPVVILSGDKDLLQLVSPEVVQLRPGTTSEEYWDEVRVEREYGIPPQQIPYYMAMVGDTSDGVVGIPGIGPKRALAVLTGAEGDWQASLDRLGEDRAAQAILARRLVDLRYPEWAAYSQDETCARLRTSPGIVAAFDPTGPATSGWVAMQEFLDRWRLTSVKERLIEGSLWYTGRSAPDNSEAAFEEFEG